MFTHDSAQAGSGCGTNGVHVFAGKWSRLRIWVPAAILVAVAAGAFVLRGRGAPEPSQMPFSDLLRDIERGAVSALVVDGDTLDVTLADGARARTVAPAGYITANAAFIPDLARKHVRIEVRTVPDQSAYSYGALVLGLAF